MHGRSTWTYGTNTVRMHVRVTGLPGHRGRLTATGGFGFGGPFRPFAVTGTLGGRSVDVRVPAS